MATDSPMVEAAGYLKKIQVIAGAPVIDDNKRTQLFRLASKTLALLPLIAQPSALITPETP